MINGESRTGITLFQLADGVDNGPVVGQLEVEINSDDTIASLYERVEALGLRLLAHYFPRIAAGSAVFLAQDESRRRIMPQRSPGDGQIDWNWPASRIRNFVRAQTHPYPGAFTCLRGSLVKIWAAREWSTPAPTMSPGLVALHDGHVIVGCSNSVIELAIVEAEGQELPASEWWKRYVPRHHERFA
jgi:methionyl-tRNA formyltransferase